LGNIAQIQKLIGAVAETFAIDYAASFDRCAARFEVITDDEQRNNARTSLAQMLRQESFHYENLNHYQLALDLLQVASAQAKQLPSTASLERSIAADMWRSAQLARDQRPVTERILRHCGLWEGPIRTLANQPGPPSSSKRDPDEARELQLVLDPEFLSAFVGARSPPPVPSIHTREAAHGDTSTRSWIGKLVSNEP